MPEASPSSNISELKIFRPSEFMRTRRPELFSDTPTIKEPFLDKPFLEYYLDTLTNRKQEQSFEEFCRRLAEIEICQNLKPQTGPTGGGDSQVDASTYPVAPSLAERAYWGSPNPPSSEAWAFAFSCKKKWKPKVSEDMDKIAKLPRQFTKAYFISSQFIRDKARAQAESDLSSKHGFEVHILDRSWIVNRVIEHKREDLAIRFLGIQPRGVSRPTLGYQDASRKSELDQLIVKLGRPEQYQGNDYALVEDYREAGILSRALGNDRASVEGFFERARHLAQTNNYTALTIRCGYDHAWTVFWWFDDILAMEKIYSQIESFVADTDEAEECELFANLWFLLKSSVAGRAITASQAQLDGRLAALRRAVSRIASNRARPNNALHAETESLLLDLFKEDPVNVSAAKVIFEGLIKCLRRSVGLGHYPAERFINNLTEMGELLGEVPGYEEMFGEIRKVASSRFGEIAEGRLLFKRGVQQLQKDNFKTALLSLGKARLRLWKRETMKLGVRSALACCDAYYSMGLFWAARMEALLVAHTAMRTREALNDLPTEAAEATIRMARFELMLGRITQFLIWNQMSWVHAGHLQSLGFDTKTYVEDLQYLDGFLGCLFLNQTPQVLQAFANLGNALKEQNLVNARVALFYALGNLSQIKDELPLELFNNKQHQEEYFQEWKAQLTEEELPTNVNGEATDHCKYETTIMNVKYALNVPKKFSTVVYAENILGIIEAALALARWEQFAFVVEEFRVFIDEREDAVSPPSLQFEKAPGPNGHEIIWGPDMLVWLQGTNRDIVGDHFMKLLLRLLLSITIDPWKVLKAELDVWHAEDTFSRALGISPISLIISDLVNKERYELAYWSNPSTTL